MGYIIDAPDGRRYEPPTEYLCWTSLKRCDGLCEETESRGSYSYPIYRCDPFGIDKLETPCRTPARCDGCLDAEERAGSENLGDLPFAPWYCVVFKRWPEYDYEGTGAGAYWTYSVIEGSPDVEHSLQHRVPKGCWAPFSTRTGADRWGRKESSSRE